MSLQRTEERENTLRAVGLKDSCSKEKGTVSSMGADIGPRNAGNGKTHQLPTKVGTTNEQRNECKNSSCDSSLRSTGDPICSSSVQPTTPPRRRYRSYMMASITGPRWTRRDMRKARKHS
eukprot:scaffold692_cov181-Chaetoceros_neogracile.AAC.2